MFDTTIDPSCDGPPRAPHHRHRPPPTAPRRFRRRVRPYREVWNDLVKEHKCRTKYAQDQAEVDEAYRDMKCFVRQHPEFAPYLTPQGGICAGLFTIMYENRNH